MADIQFFLKNPPKKNGECAVFAYTRLGREQLKIYPGIYVRPTQWSKSKQRVKPSVTNALTYNDLIEQTKADLKRIIADLNRGRIEPTTELVKSRYEAMFKKDASRSGKTTVFDYWEEWLTESERTKRKQTLKNYRAILNHIRSYCNDKGIHRLTFDRMDKEFVNSLASYLLKVKNMTNATLWNVFKTWKAFMKWAVERDLTTNRDYETVTKKAFRVTSSEQLRLTKAELKAIATVDLPEKSFLDNARNLFVLQCCLGIRFGDLQRLVENPKEHISSDGKSITLTTQKTGKQVSVPLIDVARQILLDGNVSLRNIANQNFNSYIKEVAERASLTESFRKTVMRGTVSDYEDVRRCDEISSHTAKRTFVSLMIEAGATVEDIMLITGNTRSTIDQYVILDGQKVRNRVLTQMNRLLEVE